MWNHDYIMSNNDDDSLQIVHEGRIDTHNITQTCVFVFYFNMVP